MGYLYRGVCKRMDIEWEGKLRPKGNQSRISMKIGDSGLKIDGTWTVGRSEENTVRAHQLESGRHNGCLISTTRNEQRALFYATNDNKEEGFVYIIDEDRLKDYGVVAYERVYKENTSDEEVSLMAANNDELPNEIIFAKYEVKPKGRN